MGLKQREGYQTDDGCYSDQQRIAYLPFKQDDQATDSNQRSKPIADGDLPQQNTRPEYRADGGAVGALNESLDV